MKFSEILLTIFGLSFALGIPAAAACFGWKHRRLRRRHYFGQLLVWGFLSLTGLTMVAELSPQRVGAASGKMWQLYLLWGAGFLLWIYSAWLAALDFDTGRTTRNMVHHPDLAHPSGLLSLSGGGRFDDGSNPAASGMTIMTTPRMPHEWLFSVGEAPVLAAVSSGGITRNIHIKGKKALIAMDTGEVVGVVGDGYKVFTNQQAIELCQSFCRETFPDTTPHEWEYQMAHGPSTRSWAAMDILHRSHTMNLMGIEGGESEIYTPYARITNSYNGSRALRIDVGFMRRHCANGVIFEQEAATVKVPHTRRGMHALKIAKPFSSMTALCDNFRTTLTGVRQVSLNRDEASKLVRAVAGWPILTSSPKPTDRRDQEALDADLEARVDAYRRELGENAYAAFNAMTDIAAHPPRSPRFRRDRPTLERRAGAWLRDFATVAAEPGFTIQGHLDQIERGASGHSRSGSRATFP
jgi:hypothetical protein